MISGTLLLAATTVCMLAPAIAHGHAVVQKASLSETAVKANTATEVTLTFNSGIEAGFTRVVLVDARGREQRLDLGTPADPATVRVTLPPLPPGPYGLRYKVLAVDGHVTENMLRFTVIPSE